MISGVNNHNENHGGAMKLSKDSGFDPATLLFTSLAVVLALVLLIMLGRDQGHTTAATVVAGLTVVAAVLAYGARRRARSGGKAAPYWTPWVETAGATAEADRRRSMLPYVALFALVYGLLVAAAVVVTVNFEVRVPLLVYLLFIWGADQIVLRRFAQRASRPLRREELVALYSGTALIIVLAELPSVLAVSQHGAWTGTTVALYLVIAALVFTVHYFALTRLPTRAVRGLGRPGPSKPSRSG